MQFEIQAVGFDLDNTLWDVEPVIARAELVLHDWLREHYPRIPDLVTIEDMREARLQLARDEPHRAYDFTYLRTESLARHARDCGYDGGEVSKLAFEIFIAGRNQVDLYDDVRPALTRLRSRYRLATLTNGNADLAKIGIAGLFEISLSARGVGVAKPDARAFERLAGSLGIEPARIVFVGDDPECDVDGPRAAGMKTVWINRRGALWPDRFEPPDLSVRDLGELVRVLCD